MDGSVGVPRDAIAAFERVTGLSVAIHDLGGVLANHLPPERLSHETAACLAVKATRQADCTAFCSRRTHEAMRADPGGRIQVCHAGLLEVVVGHVRDGRLEWVLFAGQRRPGRGLDAAAPGRAWPSGARPARIDLDEAAALLELARQLAARLAAWQSVLDGALARGDERLPGPGDLTSRRLTILAFIKQRHHHPLRLRDLARHLHLSEGRTGHAVREACGHPFIELLVAARVETARALLRHTELAAADIARRSGFRDLSHFHHVFRRRQRCTPMQYRAGARRAAPV